MAISLRDSFFICFEVKFSGTEKLRKGSYFIKVSNHLFGIFTWHYFTYNVAKCLNETNSEGSETNRSVTETNSTIYETISHRNKMTY